MTTANPILAREIKERMRALRAPIVLTVYLLMLGLVVFGVERTTGRESPFASLTAATAGRTVYHYLLAFLLLLLVLMVPAISAGSISGERERETLHLVQVTTLSPHRIVLGKLGASMSWVTLLALATVPLVSVSFVLGGVSVGDVARGYAFVLFVALTVAMVTIGISARMRRTIGATVVAFLFVAAITIGTAISFGLVRAWMQIPARLEPEPVWILTLNPFVGTASAIQGRDTGGVADVTPFEAAFSFLHQAQQPPGSFSGRFPGGFVPGGPPPAGSGGRAVPIWAVTSIEYAALIAFGYAMAVSGVRAPRHVFRSGRKRRRGEVTA